MSLCNGGIPSQTYETFFNSEVKLSFPELEEGKIDTFQFLEASRGVVELLDQFGKIFAAVKYDMNGNIKKINNKYQEDPVVNKYLQNLVLNEQQKGSEIATDALMWLRRGLEFFHAFLKYLIEDGEKAESVSPILKTAYASTLQQYHGWMAQRLFSLVAKMCPSRTQIFLIMALNQENREEIVLRDMTAFNLKLDVCINELKTFYRSNNFESNEVV